MHTSDQTGTDHTTRRTRLLSLLTAALLIGSILSVVPGSDLPARAATTFGASFHTQDNGAVLLAGNSVVTCPSTASACTAAKAGQGSTVNNNDFTMAFVDVDGDATTFDSSSATTALPDGATVLYAQLNWAGRTAAASGGALSTGSRTSMLVKAPGAAGYSTVTATSTSTLSTAYDSMADVTALVRAAGPGVYTGANVFGSTGADAFAAWTLVVAYRLPSLPLRDLTVFSGFQQVSSASQTITISGFLTPASGQVRTQVGVVAFEGDLGYTGDSLTLNGTALSDATTPANNFFDSADDDNGTFVTTRTPADRNLFGSDIKNVAAPGVLANGSSSATITLATSGDTYYPAVVTTAIDLYAPAFPAVTKSVTDLSGHDPAQPGDVLRYTLNLSNTGGDAAVGSVLRDPLPAGLTYVPGSLVETSGASVGPKTDVAGDDEGEYQAGPRQVRVRIGTGATATTGGRVAPGDTVTVVFDATVQRSAAGTSLDNNAALDYRAETLGSSYSYTGNTVSTPVAPLADVAVTQTADATTVAPGQRYGSTVTVTDNGPSDAAGTTTTTSVPSGTRVVSATPDQGSCQITATSVTCALGTVTTATPVRVLLVVEVDPDRAAGGLASTTAVTTTTADDVPGNDTDGVVVTAAPSAAVSLTGTADPAGLVPGESITYTLKAADDGPSDATDVVVTTPLPDGLTLVSATPSAGTCDGSGGTVSCSLGTVAAGTAATVTIVARLAASFTGTSVTTTATRTTSTPDAAPGRASATVTTPVGPPSADLSVVAVAGASTVVAGRTSTTTFTVTDGGPSDAVGTALRVAVPVGTTLVAASSAAGPCEVTGSGADTVVTCALGTIPAGARASVSVQVRVDPATTGRITVTGTATADTADPSAAADTGSVDVGVTTSADLRIAKTVDPATLVAGSPATYRLTVTDDGPSDATGVVVTDEVPAPLVAESATVPGGTCSIDGRTVTCRVGTVAAGADVTASVVVRVPASGVPDPLANTASVTADTPDPDPSDDSATYSATTTASADLVVQATQTPSTVTAGRPVRFTVTARDDGPSDATGVELVDTLPAGLTGVTAQVDGRPCQVDGRTVTCAIGALDADDRVVLTVDATVAPGASTAPLTNSATVSGTAPSDPTASNDTDTSTSTVVREADLGIAVPAAVRPVPAGATVPVRAVVTNAGPSDATGTVAVVPLPTGTVVGSASWTNGGVTTPCDTTGGLVRCALGRVAAGATVDIVVSATIDPGLAPGDLTYTARVDGVPADPDPDNDTVTRTVPVYRSVDLTQTAQVTAAAVAGAGATYRFTTTDNGPSDAPGTVVVLTAPDGTTITSATVSQGGCVVSGLSARCTVGTLGAGSRATATLVVTVPADATGRATATASASSDTADRAPGDEDASAGSGITRAADLQVGDWVAEPAAVAGTATRFTLTTVDGGPSDATGTVLTDRLPAGVTVTGVTVSGAGAGTGTCTTAAGPSGTTDLRCELGTLAPGSTVTVAVDVTLDGALPAGRILRDAAAASSDTPDPTPDDRSAAATVTVSTRADLTVTGVAVPDVVVPGSPFSYALTVTSTGPSVARAVVLTDDLPAGVTATGATSPAGRCVVTTDSGTGRTHVRCELGDTGPGSLVVTISGVVLDAGSTLTSLSDVVTVTSPTPDAAPRDRTTTVVTPVQPSADLAVRAAASPSVASAGALVTLTLGAAGTGPSAARGVTVSAVLPVGVTVVDPGPACTVTDEPAPGRGLTCRIGTGTTPTRGGTIRPGTTSSATVVVRLDPSSTGPLAIPVRVSATTQDPDVDDDSTVLSLDARTSADLQVTDVISPTVAVAGRAATHTVTVHDAGPSTARDVVLIDRIPAGQSVGTVTTTRGSCSSAAGSDGATILRCALGAVVTGRTVVVGVPVTVGSRQPAGTFTSSASATSSTPDPAPGNNTAVVAGRTAVVADLAVRASAAAAGGGTATPGRRFSYRFTVVNDGPSAAPRALLTVRVPVALSRVTFSGTSVRSCVEGGQVLRCALGTLDDGARADVTFDADVAAAAPAEVVVTAAASSQASDPAMADNAVVVDVAPARTASATPTPTAAPTSPVTPTVPGTSVTAPPVTAPPVTAPPVTGPPVTPAPTTTSTSGPAGPVRLPRTGVEVGAFGLLAGGFLALGSVLRVVGRRRRR